MSGVMSEGLRDRLATIIAGARAQYLGRQLVGSPVQAEGVHGAIADALIAAGVVLPTDPPPLTEHRCKWLTFTHLDHTYLIECSCGWRWEKFRAKLEAIEQFAAHVAAARVPDPTPPARPRVSPPGSAVIVELAGRCDACDATFTDQRGIFAHVLGERHAVTARFVPDDGSR